VFALGYGDNMVPELLLAFPNGLFQAGELPLAPFGFPEAFVEDFPGFGDLLGLRLEVGVQIVHLFPLALERGRAGVERRFAVAVRGLLGGDLSFQTAEFGLPFREAAPLGLELGARLLGLHREDLLPGLDLDVLGGSSLLEAA